MLIKKEQMHLKTSSKKNYSTKTRNENGNLMQSTNKEIRIKQSDKSERTSVFDPIYNVFNLKSIKIQVRIDCLVRTDLLNMYKLYINRQRGFN